MNIALFALIAVIGILYSKDLAWGAQAIAEYRKGQSPPLVESLLRSEAYELMLADGDPKTVESLLLRSLEIEPNTNARYLLGLVYQSQGRLEEAYRAYDQYRRIDALHLDSWLRMEELLLAAGRLEERAELLDQGIALFERAAVQFEPRPDPDVAQEFNAKALGVAAKLKRGLNTLRARRLTEPAELPEGTTAP
ncbi:hypothetical protein ABI59_03735 [Acidobacteria bacterium Mor1]|nr:hypothetical protein ABI59_03735 [Acidobacteria bacterium Mor1]